MHRLFALLTLLTPALAAGQEQKVETHSIVLHPAQASTPALRYALLPEVGDLKPGNAILFYQRAHSPEWWNLVARDDTFEKTEWFQGSLASFPKKEAAKLLQYGSLLKEIDYAARRAHCDWELTDRMRAEGVYMLLPEMAAFRRYGHLAGVRSRLALTDKKYAAANHSLQTGFALSRHVAEAPTLINFLVAVGIGTTTTVAVEDWVQIPGAPNLYWPLTDLPTPFLSLRHNMQGERLLAEQMFPGAREALRDPKKPVPKIESVTKPLESLRQISGDGGADAIAEKFLGEAWVILKLQKEAREYLIQNGRTAAQVDALEQRQVVALYLVAQYERSFDEFLKVANLPFWQAYPAMVKADDELKAQGADRPEAMMFPRALLPAIKNIWVAQARLDRRIAVLRSFEAIRLYAAQNDGKLLEKWDDLRVPVPLDPATGRPFDYRREGDRAIMNLVALPGRPDTAVRYEISLGK
jgi:hypothetical protein